MEGQNHQWVLMILIKIKGPIINNIAIYEFSSKTEVLFFVGAFIP